MDRNAVQKNLIQMGETASEFLVSRGRDKVYGHRLRQ